MRVIADRRKSAPSSSTAMPTAIAGTHQATRFTSIITSLQPARTLRLMEATPYRPTLCVARTPPVSFTWTRTAAAQSAPPTPSSCSKCLPAGRSLSASTWPLRALTPIAQPRSTHPFLGLGTSRMRPPSTLSSTTRPWRWCGPLVARVPHSAAPCPPTCLPRRGRRTTRWRAARPLDSSC